VVYKLPLWQLAAFFAGAAFLGAIIAGLLVSRARRARYRLEVFKRELERYSSR
jgi:hypothetical protein